MNIVESIEKKLGVAGLAELLADRLSGSELNSLLLDVYKRKTDRLQPAELLAQYRKNRLVQPSSLEMIGLLESSLATLRFFRGRGFVPVELSPVAALGSCSVVAKVSQDKVVSGVRGTEVVADATNGLALHVAALRKGGVEGVLRFCTVHRHVRTQPFADKRFLAHFEIGCMVTAGRDMGSYGFELAAVVEQVGRLVELLASVYGVRGFRLVVKRRGGYEGGFFERIFGEMVSALSEVRIERDEEPLENDYYRGIQFKLYIEVGGKEWEIADGGFVDWTQRLLGNRKERFLISGFGLELLFKMQQGIL